MLQLFAPYWYLYIIGWLILRYPLLLICNFFPWLAQFFKVYDTIEVLLKVYKVRETNIY